MILITDRSLDPALLLAGAASPADGAVSLFIGVVRNNAHGHAVDRIEYSAYRPLAENEMQRIEAEATRRFGLTRVAIIHRLGTLEVGEGSLGVCVASPHRQEGLDAVAFIVAEIKKRVPIWKKEFGPDGSRWVEGEVHPDRRENRP